MNTGTWRVELTQEERDILRGGQGPTMQTVMETVVRYAEALGADRLVEIDGDGHFVIAYAIPGIAPSMGMLDGLVAAGLRSRHPFTLDPKPPLDYENWFLTSEQTRTQRVQRVQRLLSLIKNGLSSWTGSSLAIYSGSLSTPMWAITLASSLFSGAG